MKLEKQHPQVKTMWDTLASVPKIPTMQAKQPESINRQLKPFQLEGLNWMMEQEKSQWKGGLLGDEMGMGKTIQAVVRHIINSLYQYSLPLTTKYLVSNHVRLSG